MDAGDLGLPDFQRSFIWTPSDVVELLRTVARVWPCGTFLLQEGPQPFACKPITGAPALKAEPKLLVLDGQQRITALYNAVREKGKETYYVDTAQLAAADESYPFTGWSPDLLARAKAIVWIDSGRSA